MLNFIELIGDSSLYNFHSHTQFCDGHAPMADFAAEAVRQGFSHYGFSPHSPVPIQSPCNMSVESVNIYFDEVARLRTIHAGSSTRFYCAMEVDYLGTQWGPATPYIADLPLDYRIGSVHFIPAQDGTLVDIDGKFESFRRKMHEFFRNDIRYVVNKFFDQSLEMLARGGFDIIGHYDKVGHNASHFQPGIEEQGWYRDRLDQLTSEIIKSGVTVEINTKAWTDHHRMFPNPDVWPELISNRVPIIVNSDAHWPALINASRSEALALLQKIS